MKKLIVLLSFFLLIMSCAINTKTINKSKKLDSTKKSTDLETYANNYFWENFHDGNYENIDSVLYYLNAAYVQNPNHLETVAHLGFTHIWALSERSKMEELSPRVIENGTLSMKYFGEAYRLNPYDPRILGFLGDLKMTVGGISEDDKLSRQGYFDGKKSIRQWKEFNYFTLGYPLSQLEHDSWQFDKGLEWQWKTLDECYCEEFDRENPDISKYIPMAETETDLKRKRACWNSWIVPHNVEGFYLNMGDMLVKDGNWEKGIEIYNLAKQVPQYENWAYKDVLESKIANAEKNVAIFRNPDDYPDKDNLTEAILIESSISCMACHQMTEKDKAYYKDFDWENYKEDNNIYWLKKMNKVMTDK